jgi:hypothetical protein
MMWYYDDDDDYIMKRRIKDEKIDQRLAFNVTIHISPNKMIFLNFYFLIAVSDGIVLKCQDSGETTGWPRISKFPSLHLFA